MEIPNDTDGFIQDFNSSTLEESAEATARRRSSNRSIKRRKFDDELVEYSLGAPGISNIKSGRSRTQIFQSDLVSVGSPQTPIPILAPMPPTVLDAKKKSISKSTPGSSKSKRRNMPRSQLSTKDLGRWKPTDDLALIIGVQQTNDLKTVHLGTKFSCKFTLSELQSRWYALLYDHAISRLAVAAMRNLHPETIAAVQDKALWSQDEERILSTIKSNTNPNLEIFSEMLSRHTDIFHSSRTTKSLFRHWQSLRQFNLLPDQIAGTIGLPHKPILSFEELEKQVMESDGSDSPDESVDMQMRIQHRRNMREIRRIENELGRYNVLVNAITGVCPGEMDNQTLAVLRGRMVRYLMRSREITIGRSCRGHSVDIDLSLEGPASKVSRRQATLRLRNTGEFYLSSEGSRPIFVNSRPIYQGNKVRLLDNAVVEIAKLSFIFAVNHDLIRSIHNESVR